MSEPRRKAKRIQEVVPGLWWWSVIDDRIGDTESDAHAVAGDGGTVLIDPLPLTPKPLRQLEPVAAICLTAACHQRSAWRYRKAFGVKVHAPQGSRAMDEEPDAFYGAGEMLPGGLQAVHTPGPEWAHFAFWREQAPAVLFCPDLLMATGDGEVDFIPPQYHDDPQATRDSVRRLLDLPFEVLCLDHGPPIRDDPHAALRRLLESP